MTDSRTNLYQTKYSDGLPKGAPIGKIVGCFADSGCRNLLDIGGGEGDFLAHCTECISGVSGTLVEIAEEAVAKAKEKGIDAFVGDVGNAPLPFEDESFDGVHCGDVIEHVFDTDRLMSEIARVVKPGCSVVLTTPNLAFWFNRLALLFGIQPMHTHLTNREGGHIRVFTFRSMKRFLLGRGWRIKNALGYGINTNLGYGKRFKMVASLANVMTNWSPSLSSHMTFVLERPSPSH